MARQLRLYDDADLSTRQNLVLTPGPVEKLGKAGLKMLPSDLGLASCFAGSVVPMPQGGFRLYYSAVGSWSPAMFRIALAESADGLNWDKPPLGQVEHQGLQTNWIWPEGMPHGASITQPQVCPLPDGTWRMWYWWHGHDIARVRYVACESQDGINWRVIDLDMPHIMHPSDRELGQNAWVAGLTAASPRDRFADERTLEWTEAKRLRSNDATYVYYNEDTARFDMYSVWLMPNDPSTGRHTPHDNAPAVLRAIQRRESPDGIVWSDPDLVITPDAHDPMHQQFYHLAVHRQDEWSIGLLGSYRCWEQTMDIELCFSRDTRHWLRPLRGGWIPRGGIDETDYMSAYPTNRLIDEGATWLLLYEAGNMKHNHELPVGVAERSRQTMAARIPKGRFAGLQAPDRAVGSLTTRPFILGAEHISLNANVRGRLQAELRDPYGRPLPGYELNSCLPVAGDSHRHTLRWHGNRTTADYLYDPVSLRVEIEDGTVYSIEV